MRFVFERERVGSGKVSLRVNFSLAELLLALILAVLVWAAFKGWG